MKKVSSKKLVGILCLLLVVTIGFVGCGNPDNNSKKIELSQDTSSREEILPDQDGNPYSTHKIVDGETIVEYDYSEAYEKLDLSEYTEHGKFGKDGIMWVKKSDYTGIQYGYIDYKGNMIVSLTSEIAEVSNFKDGFAIIKLKKDYVGFPKCSIINKSGNSLLEYYSTMDCKEMWGQQVTTANKNIIVVRGAHENYNIDNTNRVISHILFTETNKHLKIYSPEFLHSFEAANISVSDGLVRIATYDGQKGAIFYRPNTIQYFDENGELVLKIDDNSNENYEHIQYVENFIDGKAVLTFEGKDDNLYNVTIDKQGEWLDKPVMIQRSSAKSFQG